VNATEQKTKIGHCFDKSYNIFGMLRIVRAKPFPGKKNSHLWTEKLTHFAVGDSGSEDASSSES